MMATTAMSRLSRGLERISKRKGQKVKGQKDKFTEWWTMHISIPLGALMLSYRTLKEEVQGK